MTAEISINQLQIWTILGVFPEERVRKRPVVFDIRFACDISAAAESDNLNDAINYAAIREAIVAFVEASSFELIEPLAVRVGHIVLAFDGVLNVTVTLTKPAVFADCESISITTTIS